MKSIVILSGKGGVGKSSITASLAKVFSRYDKIVCADCDVDASNLSLLFGLETKDYVEWILLSTNQKAVVDENKCIGCMKCIQSCYFNALHLIDDKPKLKKFGCEGCGVCELVCPTKAIKLENINNAFIGYANIKNDFYVVSAQLLAGNSGSGKVVFEVKQKAKKISPNSGFMIIDSAAGIGCPVISSVSGSDYAVLVTEPTPSGYNDLLKALDVVNHFKIKCGIIINKFDLNEEYTKKIKKFSEDNNINIIAQIKFDKSFVYAMTKMIPVIEYDNKYEIIFEDIRLKIIEDMNE